MNWPVKVSVYAAGAAINGVGALEQHIQRQLRQLHEFATNSVLAAVAELGTDAGPTCRLMLDPRVRWSPEWMDDTNAGDPVSLVEFFRWAQYLMPSERNVLVLSGHGLAWQDDVARNILATTTGDNMSRVVQEAPTGVTWSSTSALAKRSVSWSKARAILLDGTHRDFLSNVELGTACTGIKNLLRQPIDCLLLDACLMSSWEVLYELDGSVSSVVASLDELSAAGVQYADAAHQFSLTAQPLSYQQLATGLAQAFRPAASFDSCVAVDLKSPDWMRAIKGLEEVSSQLLRWLQGDQAHAAELRRALRVASSSVVRARSASLADARSLFAVLRQLPDAPTILIDALDTTERSLEACILVRTMGRDYQDALGISLFSPNSVDVYHLNRPEYTSLKMSQLSGWGAVLDAAFNYH